MSKVMGESGSIFTTENGSIFRDRWHVCLLELGDIEAAREAFKESIEFIPEGYDYPNPYINLKRISK